MENWRKEGDGEGEKKREKLAKSNEKKKREKDSRDLSESRDPEIRDNFAGQTGSFPVH